MRPLNPSVLAATLALALSAAPALAQDCPAAVQFGPDDRLADLSARCGVAAGDILRANDAADEDALRSAGAVAIPDTDGAGEPGLLDRARDVAGDTFRRAGERAGEVGAAASDYLSDSELGRDLLELGESAGLPGVSAEPRDGPQLGAVALNDTTVRLAATGLPGDRDVVIGVARDGGMEALGEFTTRPDGTLLAELPVPEGNAPVFVLETVEGNLRLTSDPL